MNEIVKTKRYKLVPSYCTNTLSWNVVRRIKGSCTARVIEKGLKSREEALLMIDLLNEES